MSETSRDADERLPAGQGVIREKRRNGQQQTVPGEAMGWW